MHCVPGVWLLLVVAITCMESAEWRWLLDVARWNQGGWLPWGKTKLPCSDLSSIGLGLSSTTPAAAAYMLLLHTQLLKICNWNAQQSC